MERSKKLIVYELRETKVLFLLFGLLWCPVTDCYASGNDDDKNNLKKNVIYGTVGFAPIPYGLIGLSYERMIVQHKSKAINSFWVRLEGGFNATWGQEGPQGIFALTVLTGPNKNHIEVSAGVTTWYNRMIYDNTPEPNKSKSDFIYSYPAGAIGYRYQKPNGHFIIRAGVGFPELFYLSLGLAL